MRLAGRRTTPRRATGVAVIALLAGATGGFVAGLFRAPRAQEVPGRQPWDTGRETR